jgi:hypothetical protein
VSLSVDDEPSDDPLEPSPFVEPSSLGGRVPESEPPQPIIVAMTQSTMPMNWK